MFSNEAIALLDLLESDFGQSGRDVRIEAIRCELESFFCRGQGSQMEPSINTYLILRDRLKNGGAWLSAARGYVQSHASNGETVRWGSEESVTLSMRQIEELAIKVAIAAIYEQST